MYLTKTIVIYLSVVLLARIGESTLQVSNFAQMRPDLQDIQLKNIPYSIANFGFAPFGKTMIAHLYTSPGLDSQCNNNNKTDYPKQLQNSFLLIPRGECPFVTKALHAQDMNAKMAIIMDNEEHDMGVIMKDNGYGYKVNIPAIFINHKYGNKLLALLNSTNNKVKLKIFFENKKTDKAQVSLYMQSFSRLSYNFIEQFKPFYNKIKKDITLKLVYDVIQCKLCNPDDCYNQGQYCSVNYVHKNSSNGKFVLDQQLREQVLFEKHLDKWWDYIHCFDSQCSVITQGQECSDRCLAKPHINIDPQTFKKQVKSTYVLSSNKIFQRNVQQLNLAGIQNYPSISINNNRIKGTLNPEFVFDDICNTLLKPPSQCSKYIIDRQDSITSDKMYWFIIILVLILSAGLFTALFVICRRQMKKRMSQEMQGRVDDMVSKYIQFYSQRNNRK